MSDDTRRRAEQIFQTAALLDSTRLESYVRVACGDDAAVEAEVRSLLAAEGRMGDFLAQPAGGASLASDALPARVGRYQILRRIGEGGMGVVYEARQENPRRTVALKLVRPGFVSHALIRRFEQEVAILGRLAHPGIARIYEAGTADVEPAPRDSNTGAAEPDRPRTLLANQPYFAMELVRGATIIAYSDQKRLEISARVELFAQVCEAVQYAHTQGVIHRDLKPGNILVDEFGQPKILDFGVARLIDRDAEALSMRTGVGQLIGTLPYMSPEQVAGDPAQLDARSDVYTLGVILFELLAGRPPHDLRDRPIPEAARIIREEEPSRLSSLNAALRGDIETIVGKALEKERQRRYASAAELAADIRRFLQDQPIHARPVSTWYQFRKFSRRNRGLVAGVAVALLVLIAGIIVSCGFALSAMRQRGVAEQRAIDLAHQAYRAGIAAAAAALQAGDVGAARRNVAAAPPELRGWEWRYYQRAADRSLFTLDGHSGVPTVSISADGRRLATADNLPRIRVWSLSSGALEQEIPVPAEPRNFALRPDGSSVLWSDAQSRTQLIDLDSRATIWQLDFGLVLSADAFSPDGTCFAAGRNDQLPPAIFDAASGRLLAAIRDADARPVRPRFAPDGRHLALHDYNGNIVVADSAERRALWHGGGWRFGFTPDGGALTIVESGASGGELHLLDIRSGHIDRIFPLGSHAAESWAFRDAALELTLADAAGMIETLDLADLRPHLRLAAHHGAASLCYSRDGAHLISSGPDGAVRVWDGALSAAPLLVRAARYDLGYAATLSADGRRIVRVGWGCASLLDTQTGATRWRRYPTRKFMCAAAFSPDGAEIAIAGQGESILVLDADSGETIRTLRVPDALIVFSLRWFPDGRNLLATLDNGEVRILDAQSGTATILGRHESSATCSAIGPNGDLAATGSGNGLPGGDFGVFSTPANDRAIRIWDVRRAAQLQRLEGHRDAVTCVTFSPDGARLASGSLDQTAIIWDARSGARLLDLQDAGAAVRGIAFSPDGTRIVASCDETVRLWHAASGELLASLPCGPGSAMAAVEFTPDGASLIASGAMTALALFETGPPACGEAQRELAVRARRLHEHLDTGQALCEDIARQIAADPTLTPELRAAAIEQTRAIGDPATRFISDALIAAGEPQRQHAEYRLALRKLESAIRTYPDEWRLLPTLGLLELRTGETALAAGTLQRAAARFAENRITPPVQLTLALAMSDWRAGEKSRARERLRALNAGLAGSRESLDARTTALLREAGDLIGNE